METRSHDGVFAEAFLETMKQIESKVHPVVLAVGHGEDEFGVTWDRSARDFVSQSTTLLTFVFLLARLVTYVSIPQRVSYDKRTNL